MNNKNKYFSKSAKHSVTKNTIKKSSIKKGDDTVNGLPFNSDAMFPLWQKNEKYRQKSGIIDNFVHDPKDFGRALIPIDDWHRYMYGEQPDITDVSNKNIFPYRIPSEKTDRKTYDTQFANFNWNRYDNSFDDDMEPKSLRGIPEKNTSVLRQFMIGEPDSYRNWQSPIKDLENYNTKMRRRKLGDVDINRGKHKFGTLPGNNGLPYYHTPVATNLEYDMVYNNFANSLSNAFLSNSYFSNALPKSQQKQTIVPKDIVSSANISALMNANKLPDRTTYYYLARGAGPKKGDKLPKTQFINPTDATTYSTYSNAQSEKIPPPPMPPQPYLGPYEEGNGNIYLSYEVPAEFASSSTYQNLFNQIKPKKQKTPSVTDNLYNYLYDKVFGMKLSDNDNNQNTYDTINNFLQSYRHARVPRKRTD